MKKEKCLECNGTGKMTYNYFPTYCNTCHGYGELDWIEKIVGPSKWKMDLFHNPCGEVILGPSIPCTLGEAIDV